MRIRTMGSLLACSPLSPRLASSFCIPPELSGPAELGGAGVSQAHLLQQGWQRRTLCGLGTTATLFRRGSRGLQTTAQIMDCSLAGLSLPSAETHWNRRPLHPPSLGWVIIRGSGSMSADEQRADDAL